MKAIHILLELLSRVAVLFFALLIGAVFFTFLVSMFLPNLSTSLRYVSAIVAALSVIAAIYAVSIRYDRDEKLWDIIPNPFEKGKNG